MTHTKDESTSHIDCYCYLPEHSVRFTTEGMLGDRSSEPVVFMDYQLNPLLGFWKRLISSFKYVFNIGQNQWDCVILTKTSVENIEDIFKKFKRAHKTYELTRDNICLYCEGQGGVSSCNTCGLCASCKQVRSHLETCHLGNPFASPFAEFRDLPKTYRKPVSTDEKMPKE